MAPLRILGRAALPATVLLLTLFPTPASAATIAVVGEELLIGAEPDERNVITLERVKNRFLVTDASGLEPGAGCSDEGDHVSCRARNILRVVIQTGDGNDVVRVTGAEAFVDGGTGKDRLFGGTLNVTLVGGPGNDRLQGGVANDLLRGGAGDDRLTGDKGLDVLRGASGQDRLNSRDGERDVVAGGGGTDEGTVDRKDRVRGVEVLGDF